MKTKTNIALCVVVLMIVMLGVIVKRYSWFRSWNVTVTYNGLPSDSTRVYRDLQGDALVDMRSTSGCLYVVRKIKAVVGIPNPNFVLENQAIILTRQYPLPIVDVRTEKAGAFDPCLLMSADKVSFITIDGKIIQINWH